MYILSDPTYVNHNTCIPYCHNQGWIPHCGIPRGIQHAAVFDTAGCLRYILHCCIYAIHNGLFTYRYRQWVVIDLIWFSSIDHICRVKFIFMPKFNLQLLESTYFHWELFAVLEFSNVLEMCPYSFLYWLHFKR